MDLSKFPKIQQPGGVEVFHLSPEDVERYCKERGLTLPCEVSKDKKKKRRRANYSFEFSRNQASWDEV